MLDADGLHILVHAADDIVGRILSGCHSDGCHDGLAIAGDQLLLQLRLRERIQDRLDAQIGLMLLQALNRLLDFGDLTGLQPVGVMEDERNLRLFLDAVPCGGFIQNSLRFRRRVAVRDGDRPFA